MEYILFTTIMFAFAILFIIIGILIFHGKTNLIHSYHQTRVKNKAEYGKSFGKIMCGSSIPFLVSGAIPIFKQSDSAIITSICIFFVLFIICLIMFYRVQKKYNSDVF